MPALSMSSQAPAANSSESPSLSTSFPSDENRSFQKILELFPHLSVHELYPLFVLGNGDLSKTMNLVLDREGKDSSSSDGKTDGFKMVLDAELVKRQFFKNVC